MTVSRARQGRRLQGLGALAFALAAGLVTAPARGACDDAASYAAAGRAFADGRYDESVQLLEQAYACAPNPVYLANVARSYEEANLPRDAVSAWRRYLAAVTDARERRVTEGRISALTKLVADLDRLEEERSAAVEASRRAADARSAPPAASRGPRVSAGAIATAGVGVAGLVAGLVLGAIAESKHAGAVGAAAVDPAEALQQEARDFATAANVSFVAGGVVAATGLAWIGVDLLGARSRGVALAPAPGAAGLALVGRF